MGMRPKPAELRLLEGTKSRHTLPDAAASPTGALVAPPGLPEAVMEVWEYTVAQLETMGVASCADRDVLVAYCHAVVNHAHASDLLRDGQVLILGLNGGWIRNPALVVQRDSALLMTRLAIEFGLTPAARTRISAKAQEAVSEDNPFAANG